MYELFLQQNPQLFVHCLTISTGTRVELHIQQPHLRQHEPGGGGSQHPTQSSGQYIPAVLLALSSSRAASDGLAAMIQMKITETNTATSMNLREKLEAAITIYVCNLLILWQSWLLKEKPKITFYNFRSGLRGMVHLMQW